MSEDNDNVSKLIVLALGIAAIGFFAYLIFKESMKYQVGSQQQKSLADDDLFNLERKIHNLENTVSRGNVRTLQPINTLGQGQGQEQGQTGQFVSSEIDAPPAPRKVVSMNTNRQIVQVPNTNNLSKADQDKVRRMFFNML